MKFQHILITGAIILSFNSCAILKTSSETNKTADFAKYKSFKMVRFYNEAQLEEKGIYLSEQDVRSVDQAIAGKVKNAGLKWSEANDVLVIWTLGLDLKSQYSKQTQAGGYGTGGYGYGYSYNYGPYGSSPTHSSVSERQTVKGKLSIAMVDQKTNELLWLGVGKKKMKVNLEDRDPEKINASIDRVMSTFPLPLKDK